MIFVLLFDECVLCLIWIFLVSWPCRERYIDSGSNCTCPAPVLLMWLHCSCEALLLWAMFDKSLKNVGRHLLCLIHSGPQGTSVCVRMCVCYTTKLVFLSPFTDNWSVWNTVLLWDVTTYIWSEGKFRGLPYPCETLGNVHRMSCKNSFPLATQPVSIIYW